MKEHFSFSPYYCAQVVERKRWEMWCATWQVRPRKVGLLWREMAIYVAENGVGLFDIFIALQARVTFSRKQND